MNSLITNHRETTGFILPAIEEFDAWLIEHAERLFRGTSAYILELIYYPDRYFKELPSPMEIAGYLHYDIQYIGSRDSVALGKINIKYCGSDRFRFWQANVKLIATGVTKADLERLADWVHSDSKDMPESPVQEVTHPEEQFPACLSTPPIKFNGNREIYHALLSLYENYVPIAFTFFNNIYVEDDRLVIVPKKPFLTLVKQ